MNYRKHYSEGDFWEWVQRAGKKAGRPVLRVGFELYYATVSEKTPLWAKGMGAVALGYLIFPFDAFMDPIYHDDLAIAASTIFSIGRYVTDEITEKARLKVEGLLGPEN